MKRFLALLRARQWYKNALLFLPLIFGLHLFDAAIATKTLIGFAAFCLLSSTNYIVNDLHDLRSDRYHAEKKRRPIAAGTVSVPLAIAIALVLFISGLAIAYSLSVAFLLFALAFVVLTQLYTFVLKDEAFADVLLISINFVLRATAGAFVVAIGWRPYVPVSSWLILCTFFLALFLVTGKREADLLLMKKDAVHYKRVLAVYTADITSSLLIVATTLLLTCYSFYIFMSGHPYLLISLPFALYSIFRYFALIKSGSVVARQPELVYTDLRLMIGGVLWAITVIGALYIH